MGMYKKKVLSWFLVLALVLGCFSTGGSITAKAAGTAVIWSIKATPISLGSEGGTVKVDVNGEDLGENVYWALVEGTQKRAQEYETAPTDGNSTTPSFEVEIPANNTLEEITYSICVNEQTPTWNYGYNAYSFSQSVAITVAAGSGEEEPEPEEADKTALEEAIKDAESKVESDYTAESWTVLQEKLAAAKAVDEDDAATAEAVNTATEDLKKAIADLVAAEPAEITSVTATPTTVPLDGGIVELKVSGKNLTANNWGFEVAKYISGTTIAASDKAAQVSIVEMTAEGATVEFSLNGMKNDIDFVFSVGPKKNGVVTGQKTVTVTQEKKNYSTEDIAVTSVQMADDSTVVATFKVDLEAAKEGDALKKLVYIANADGTTNRHELGADDTVTVDGNIVTVHFAEKPENISNSSKLYIKEGALKVVESGNIAQDFSWFITVTPQISSVTLDKDVFDNKGGTVTAILKGYKVSEIDIESTIDASVYVPGITEPTDIEVVKGSDADGNPTLTFEVPANETDNTLSYWLNVKYNGAPVYGTASSNRGDRPTVSVLPEGKTAADATLSAMTISGNNKDEVNNTTDIAVNVSSNIGELKTELRIYGTNLNSALTKVRAVDENGIVWPVYHISECDGTYRFVAIAGEHRNGVYGDGTSQLIEILPPRYIGINKTYTIQVAIDGENFIDTTTVKLQIKNEGVEGVVDCTSNNYKYVTVKYVEQGTEKELAPSETLTGYVYYMMKSFDIQPKEIPGYELVKGYEFGDDDYVGEGRTLTYEYKSTATVTPEKPEVKDPVKVSSIKVSGISKKLAAGKKVTLNATVAPANAANKAVTWKSSNTKYATVNSAGKVTLKKAGAGKTVTITATAKDGSGKKASYKIKIMKNAVKSVKLKAAKTVKAGKSTKVKATVKTTGKKVNKTLKWTSSNTKYATVNSKGKVTAKKAGKGKTVKITAMSTDGSNKKKTVKIKIK